MTSRKRNFALASSGLRCDSDGVPFYESLMRPTIEALRELGGSASNEELMAAIIRRERIPEAVQSILHKDRRRTRLEYRLAWTKTYLGKVGLLENSARGVWTLTDAADVVTDEYLAGIPAMVRSLGRAPTEKAVCVSSPITTETNDPETDALSWQNALLGVIGDLPPSAFERLCQRILRESGFIKVEVTGRSGDGGIDGAGVLRVKLVSFQIAFQCKRYQGSVGPGVVRDFRGAMVGRADKGLILTTGTFTGAAREEAVRPGAPAIDLIDGEALCELLKELRLGVRTRMVEEVSIEPHFFASI